MAFTLILLATIGCTGGVRVAASDIIDDGRPDLITGAGSGGGPHIRIFEATSDPALGDSLSVFFPEINFPGGVFVAGL